ncbi:MAG: putative sugar O-methyltransferase [Candidatus Omnitrophica bacterium]|nr:putative sugar O-methyltransferase [Candidatus Omnitrophota bacterium]
MITDQLKFNDEAISRLAVLANNLEEGRSSHWQFYLKDFSFNDGNFSGMKGFGGNRKYNFSINFVHHLMQKPYYRWGQKNLIQEICKSGKAIAKKQGRCFDLDQLRQALTLAFLMEKISLNELSGNICIIGDGFANLTNMLLSCLPSNKITKIICVNLTPVLAVDIACILKANKGVSLALVENADQMQLALRDKKVSVIALQADNCELLSGSPIGLAANIASFQEMNPEIIDQYFRILRASKIINPYIYCCNRVEKMLPDGTVTRFFDYPWRSDDEIIVDELCPWQQKYYKCMPPAYYLYDGPAQHRLARLANGSN